MKVESSFASQLYASARRMAPAEQQIAAPGRDPVARESFADALEATMAELSTRLGTGEAAARQAVAGQAADQAAAGQGDVQSVVEALTQAELALETAVTVRDKVVEAYQEILRMPI